MCLLPGKVTMFVGCAVIFVDCPITPIRPWEAALWKIAPGSTLSANFWRMYVVVRSNITEGLFGDAKSRDAWKIAGPILRSIAIEAVPNACDAYLYDYSAGQNALTDFDIDSVWISPKSSDSTGDLYQKIKAAEFPKCNWPMERCLSGRAIFFDRKNSSLKNQLDLLLAEKKFVELRKIFRDSKSSLSSLFSLLSDAYLYLIADSLVMPETADPWFLFSERVGQPYILEKTGQMLRNAGFQVYISRRIQDYYGWQEDGILPSDVELIG